MKKKKLIVWLFIPLVAIIYFVFFYKDKTLKFVPENADAVVLIDVKKLAGQYVFSLTRHPSLWFDDSEEKKEHIALKDSGIRIPDFLQVFHLKNTKFSEWYSAVELKDQQKFLTYLKQQKFTDKGDNLYQKDQVFIKIRKGFCIFGTSDRAFKRSGAEFFMASKEKKFKADQFINGTLGSFSFISEQKISNFSIELGDDEIEVKNAEGAEGFTSVIAMLQGNNHFLEVGLDAGNMKNLSRLFDKSINDSAGISHMRGIADLRQVNDTIITYGYDDNFNEVEQKSYQKIVQPGYTVVLQTPDPEKTMVYFQNKKWINAQNQLTVIPFQPNTVSKGQKDIVIKSSGNQETLPQNGKENYIFIRNNALLYSSLSSVSEREKKLLSDIEYIFYGNRGQHYYIQLKARKGDLPLILRR
ncbi:hypothetical protein [Chryseobacterium indologenes]|uniref:DUF3352 domain-containing protein n=1 Tax=Chryseobacterium indologenes TaxID=253 RepID=A0A0N0IWV8_CHRID|nr:hypothetical protein [Chryseobacterium indologenes]KPE51731.1 hypothetical protein AOB46_08780 [Chryseobacterium indologenes]